MEIVFDYQAICKNPGLDATLIENLTVPQTSNEVREIGDFDEGLQISAWKHLTQTNPLRISNCVLRI